MHSSHARLAIRERQIPARSGWRSQAPSAALLRSAWPLLVGWLALLVVVWGLGELCHGALTAADLEAVQGIAADRTPALTAAAHALSALASGYVITPLAVLCCVLLYRRGRCSAAVAVGVSIIGAAALSTLDKLLVGRPRPPVEHLEAVGSASFPSGHATAAAAFYLALLFAVLVTRPRAAVRIAATAMTALLLAGVAFSRVYLGVHYPSDVLAGLLLGASWSLLVAVVISGGAARRGPGSHTEFI